MNNAIIALIIGYAGVILVSGLLAKRERRSLVALIDSITSRVPLNAAERTLLDQAFNTSVSWRSAFLLGLAFAEGIVMSPIALDRESDEFLEAHPTFAWDPDMHRVITLSTSIAYAVNPFAGVLAIVLRTIYRVKLRLNRVAHEAARSVDARVASATAIA